MTRTYSEIIAELRSINWKCQSHIYRCIVCSHIQAPTDTPLPKRPALTPERQTEIHLEALLQAADEWTINKGHSTPVYFVIAPKPDMEDPF